MKSPVGARTLDDANEEGAPEREGALQRGQYIDAVYL